MYRQNVRVEALNVYESIALHRARDVLEQGCIDLLTEEWARSPFARKSMLEKSNDNLPYCIVLVERTESEELPIISERLEKIEHLCGCVVGHSRLCKVHEIPRAAFVESVVVRKSLRGRGLGRLLMSETEKHAERLGIETLYLTTHDKQDFYQHIGYEFCSPVISLGSASGLLSNDKYSGLLAKMSSPSTLTPVNNCIQEENSATNCNEISTSHNLIVDCNITDNHQQSDKGNLILMTNSEPPASQCILTQAPPVPPPPPCLPCASRFDSVELKSPKISWMKKHLSKAM